MGRPPAVWRSDATTTTRRPATVASAVRTVGSGAASSVHDEARAAATSTPVGRSARRAARTSAHAPVAPASVGPAAPWAGTFLETNVRLYSVDATGRRGVVFLSLDADRAVAVAAARAAGLTTRPLVEVVTEELAHERDLGLSRPRRAGLTPAYEATLLTAYAP